MIKKAIRHSSFITRHLFFLLLFSCLTVAAQNDKVFVRGADVSWCSEMEASGMRFYDVKGHPTDIFEVMQQIGLNAIRLRVWVNPELVYGAWNDKADVLAKARRAHAQGLDLLIDFHYSDYFADPGRQTKPIAWQNMSMDELKDAVAAHTKDVLQALKDEGIEPKWVQVGNETIAGMIWEEGRINWNATGTARWGNYVALSNAGYYAVKEVLPEALVIVHFPNAVDDAVSSFREFKSNGGKFDMIGLSHYPDYNNWSDENTKAANNLQKLYVNFRKPVMIVETGFSSYDETRAAQAMTDLFEKMQAKAGCYGILYWEPEVYGGWNPRMLQDDGTWTEATKGVYGKKVVSHGAFTQYGRPAAALKVFGTVGTAINQPIADNSSTHVEYFNPQGQRVNKSAKGIVFVRQGCKTTKVLKH